MIIEEIMRTAPVIPVLVVDRLEDAMPMAEALVAGGLRVLEVTLRTPVALDAIRAMRDNPDGPTGSIMASSPGRSWIPISRTSRSPGSKKATC